MTLLNNYAKRSKKGDRTADEATAKAGEGYARKQMTIKADSVWVQVESKPNFVL
jgi:hypothetical protein